MNPPTFSKLVSLNFIILVQECFQEISKMIWASLDDAFLPIF